jgi:hypothetical protein
MLFTEKRAGSSDFACSRSVMSLKLKRCGVDPDRWDGQAVDDNAGAPGRAASGS